MSLPSETRLAMLGLPDEALTPELRAVVADWSARCDRLSARAAAFDPYDTPLTARVSPFGPVREEARAGFGLRRDTDGGRGA